MHFFSFKKWWHNNWALIVLIFLILGAYAPFYVHDGFLGDFGDPIGQTIPNKILLLNYIKEGIAPLWNPFSFLGFPLLADIQVGTFYLPDLIFFGLLPGIYAHNVSLLFHLIVGGMGMFLFIRTLSRKKLTSLALALVYSLTGTMLSRIVYLNFLETVAWLPWAMWIIVKYRRESQNTKLLAPSLALLIALIIFAGHPVAFFYDSVIVVLFSLMYYWKEWKKLLLTGISFFTGICLAGVQLIPFFELVKLSVRENLSFQEFVGGSLHFQQLWQFLLPFNDDSHHFDTYIHMGSITAILVIWSLFFGLRKYHTFSSNLRRSYLAGVILIVLGLLLSFIGTIPWLADLIYSLPFVNLTRVPARYIVIVHIGALLTLVPLLSLLESTFFKNQNSRPKAGHYQKFPQGFYQKLYIIPHFLLICNVLLIPSFFLERHEIAEAQKQYPVGISNALESVQQSSVHLSQIPHYVLSSSMAIFPNRHLPAMIPLVTGYNPLMLKNYQRYLPVAPVGSFENPNYFIDYFDIFEGVGVRYYLFPTKDFLIQHDTIDKPEVRNFLIQQGWHIIKTLQNGIDLWEDPQPRPFSYFLGENNKITHISFTPGKIVLEVDMKHDDILVVNQTFVPDWYAKISSSDAENADPSNMDREKFSNQVDRREPKVLVAEEYPPFVQAYPIPHDTKKIDIFYRPASLFYGILLTLFGLALAFLIPLGMFFSSKSLILKHLHQFFRYCIVGGAGTLIDVGVLYVLVEFADLPVLFATTLSFLAAVTNNFLLNKFWTFKSTSKNYRKLYVKFLLVSLGGLVLTLLLMYFFVHILQLWYIVAKIITSGIVVVWNFLGNKFWTFKIHPHAIETLTTYDYEVSFVIPAYNEANRLPQTLEIITDYIKSQKLKAEIIVVNDGSSDETGNLIQEFAQKFSDFHPVSYDKNEGKGYAVRRGVMASRGKFILFTDADNSTPVEEFSKLRDALVSSKADIAIGSRYLPGSNVKIKQPRYRIWMGRIGNFLIRLLLTNDLKDTQCGFKLFTHEAAQNIFSLQKVKRFGFDMEALTIAYNLDYTIIEVPVSWFNSSDSRVRPLRDAFITFKDLFYIKLNLWCGRYNDEE